ncbi:MAG: flagellar biosynthetic protein FliR [Pseudomonadales bacterium]
MSLLYPQIFTWLAHLLQVVVPVGAFVMVVPVFGNGMVSPRVKMALVFAIAMALAPTLPPPPVAYELGLGTFLQTGWQLLTGVGLGLATLAFFQIFVIAGQFLGMQMGLGFAAMVDPGNGVQVTVWSQFFLMLVTLTYLALNGHLATLEVLLYGLQRSPEIVSLDWAQFAQEVAALGAWMFLGGVVISLPAVCALLIVNLAFGVMSRSAPQLNIFSLGFPFSLLFGLVVIWLSLNSLMPQFDRLSTALLAQLTNWVQ